MVIGFRGERENEIQATFFPTGSAGQIVATDLELKVLIYHSMYSRRILFCWEHYRDVNECWLQLLNP